jgi:hypothetical protein
MVGYAVSRRPAGRQSVASSSHASRYFAYHFHQDIPPYFTVSPAVSVDILVKLQKINGQSLFCMIMSFRIRPFSDVSRPGSGILTPASATTLNKNGSEKDLPSEPGKGKRDGSSPQMDDLFKPAIVVKASSLLRCVHISQSLTLRSPIHPACL